jgi:hypothetical protein
MLLRQAELQMWGRGGNSIVIDQYARLQCGLDLMIRLMQRGADVGACYISFPYQ